MVTITKEEKHDGYRDSDAKNLQLSFMHHFEGGSLIFCFDFETSEQFGIFRRMERLFCLKLYIWMLKGLSIEMEGIPCYTTFEMEST